MAVVVRGRDPRHWTVESATTIRNFFAGRHKHVVYFAGYGELGYEQEERVRSVASDVLSGWSASSVLVHAGTLLRVGGHDGIAQVYSIAHKLGIETTGIHPSVAMEHGDTHRVSSYCDNVFFVEDATWGGFLDGTDVPSPTLRLHLDVSDEIVVIGGGKHAADELRAFVSLGKRVRYFPAEMNHSVTREWSRVAGVHVTDMRGAAHAVWEQLRVR